MHGSPVCLTDFLGSYAQADYNFTARFSSLSSLLSSTSSFSRLTTKYNICSNVLASSQALIHAFNSDRRAAAVERPHDGGLVNK